MSDIDIVRREENKTVKVAVSSTGPDMNSQVNPRFGRCQYFLIVDTDTMNAEAIQNTAAMASGGAGIQAAQVVAQKGAQAVLTGSLGPNAIQALSAAGLDVALGISGTVREAVEQYKSGTIQVSPPTSAQSGQGGSTGMGTGAGVGYKMGRAGGRGGGRGMGMRRFSRADMYEQPPATAQAQVAPSGDLAKLKDQIAKLQEQLQRIERRLDEMEN